jgi:hypothetical protein
MDPVRPISHTDRSVKPVDLRRLTPLEREQERKRRERERERKRREQPPEEPDGRIDVRV